ncbi:replicative DNA helicase [Buchnera aphidicola]|uniref:Replicative DNA helicase n=1 Tax=Buchnera aphidicola (Cinara strobi) TaxID=1921549 RepID=A0A3B1DMF5_9GAMM|nr:replicative DNA helicase [Buchnera aphidicola]VAX76861.1 Replicative DNA helicase [Buchnera aphidicola (Cinara strobi)]
MIEIKKTKNNLKIPPHSLEAEQSVLGGLMLDNQQWDTISEYIIPEDFYSRQHQLIFYEMKNLIEKGSPIDLITLSESLEQKGELNNVGRFAYLAKISKNTPSITNIIAYAEIIRERAIIREIILTAHNIAYAGYYPQGRKSPELLDYAESSIFKISEIRSQDQNGPKNIEKILDKTIQSIERLIKKPNNGITGLNTGYHDLNKKTSGLQKSDLIIIAARPSMGKTTFAMNLCENTAMLYEKPILIFSLEMPGEQIMIRMLASLSRVNQSKIRTGQLSNEEWSRISSTMNILLKKKNIYIDDSSRLTPSEVRSRSRKIYKENNGLSLIMIDYLQLIKIPSLSGNRTLEIAEISRTLKALAKELNIPIIALSQLNRSLEQRSDKRPVNSDLRESGSLEQDADLILFIYRDELYHENSDFKGIAEIIIGKQRNGPTGTVHLTFNGKWSRFDNYANPKFHC